MKSARRHELQDNSLAKRLTTLPEIVKTHLRRAIIVLCVAAVAGGLVYYRFRSAAIIRETYSDNLADAWYEIAQLHSMVALPGEVSPFRGFLKDIIDHSADHAQAASALAALGDLDFALATYPPRPEAATQPAYAPDAPADELLAEARASYNKILSNYSDQLSPAIDAHFSLAAMAENEGDFDKAKDQYQAILDTPGVGAAQHAMADARLQELKDIRIAPIIATQSMDMPQDMPFPKITPPATRGVYGPVPAATQAATKPAK